MNEITITYSYFGAAKGRWIPRAAGIQEALRPEWGERTGDLFLNKEVYPTNVPEQVWQFEMGGYPVVKKWLGYRQDSRPLPIDEVRHLRSIIHRIACLLSLQAKADALYVKAAEEAFSAEELGVRPAK